MQFSLAKALWFKEWHQQRRYLLLGMLLMSLSPLMNVLSWVSQQNLRMMQKAVGPSLPGLGVLIPVFAAGLAFVTLQEMFRDEGIQFASEPATKWAMLRTKFFLGVLITVACQTFAIGWYGIVLGAYGQFGPPASFIVYWFTMVVWSMCFYSVSYVLMGFIRPVVMGILAMIILIAAPLFTAQWFEGMWIHYHPDGSFQILWPHWAYGVYNVVRDMSPYGSIHWSSNYITKAPVSYLWHGSLPLVWVIAACLLLRGVARNQPIDLFAQKVARRPVRIALRGFMTLAIAVILQRYFLQSFDGQLTVVKFAQIVVLWACCHFIVRAILAQVDRRKSATQTSSVRGRQI